MDCRGSFQMKPVVNVLGPRGLEHKQGTEGKKKTDGTAQRRPQSAGHSGMEKEGYKQGVGAGSLLLTQP